MGSSLPNPEEWRDWVGLVRTTSEWLDPQQANLMAATLGRPVDFAAGDHLPLGWHWLYFHDVVAKTGLTGPLYLVTVEHEVSTIGVPALVEHRTLVYREAEASATAHAVAPDGTEFDASWTFGSTALFRYSSLTFNGHRIHHGAD